MKIAVVQMDVALGDVERNLAEMLSSLRVTREAGAELTIFPECALTGYCFNDVAEAGRVAQTVPGPATAAFTSALKSLGGYAVFGMIEQADDGGVYNVAILVGHGGVIGHYRKIHLPSLGVDKFAKYGERPFAVYDLGSIRVGLGICYDSAFPESIRAMTLQGADLIALPTNFPTGAEGMTDYALRTRAMENHIYFAACNRVGEERGFKFIGRSLIAEPTGSVLTQASPSAPEILYAEIDPTKARNKRIVRVPGKHAIDRLADRRPEFYGDLIKPHNLPRPGRE